MLKIEEIIVLFKSRTEPIFLWSWCTALTCMIVGIGFPPVRQTVLAIFSSSLIGASVYIYNDFIDREMDGLNPLKQGKPMVSGKVSLSGAKVFIIITGIIGLLLAYIINLYTFIAALSFFTVFFIYSFPLIRLKKIFIIKELVIASGFIFSSLIGSFALIKGIHIASLFFGTVSGLFVLLCTPALNDAFDTEEDKIYNVKSLASVLNWTSRIFLMIIGVLFLIIMSYVGFTFFDFGLLLPVSVIFSSLLVIRRLPGIYSGFEVDSVLKVRRIFKLYFFFIQVMFVINYIKPIPVF